MLCVNGCCSVLFVVVFCRWRRLSFVVGGGGGLLLCCLVFVVCGPLLFVA